MKAYSALARHYDSLTTDVPYTEYADFYETLFRSYDKKVSLIVDLACGTGSMTRELAKRGYEMIGVDSSPDMLSIAAQYSVAQSNAVQSSTAQYSTSDESTASGDAVQSGETPETIKPVIAPIYICQKVEELDLYGTADAVVCSLDGLNYVSPGLIRKAFHRVGLFIEPGGLFIFDINSPGKYRAMDGAVFLDETDEVFCIWRTEYSESDKKCFYGVDIFTKTGAFWKRDREEHTQYSHEPDDLVRVLAEEGFGDIRVMGERRESKPEPDEQRIFISGRRI